MLGVLIAGMQTANRLIYALLALIGSASAVDRSKFKTCEQSKFCQYVDRPQWAGEVWCADVIVT
jgi:hypothetical protein